MECLRTLIILICTKFVCSVDDTLNVAERINPKLARNIGCTCTQGSCTLYHVQPGAKITRVMNGNELVWEAAPEERCMYIMIHQIGGRKPLAYLKAKRRYSEFRYNHYKIIQDTWYEITEREYDSLFYRLSNECVLNIRNIDLCTFMVNSYPSFGMLARMCKSFCGYDIKTVIDGPEIVWSSDEVKCEHVIIHGVDGSPRFVQLFLRHIDRYEVAYFEMGENGWTRIHKEVFFMQLDLFEREMGRGLRSLLEYNARRTGHP
ncbi:conserved hypothetical protein [Theileria equi strain WA]|uniref:Signal peptide containing protein n=1 Tax=Theileria equi strain WA TaxID=1537102 RepID=L1LE64_THEEQ|nr:conserved hypothetical protein [Theileria equi strain WA]EKX73636.1 conserved hypothetical protein [Theileria equi strain WA]|eukprot:XP_004833088.1 conserved hypothetical protein [Theileria equi strain WA]